MREKKFDALFSDFLSEFPLLEKGYILYNITKICEEIIPFQKNKHLPISLKNKVLYIKINNPALRLELNAQKETLLKKIQEKLGLRYVSKIVFC